MNEQDSAKQIPPKDKFGPWYSNYKSYAVVWFLIGCYAMYLQQPLGVAGCIMSATLSIRLSRWQRMDE